MAVLLDEVVEDMPIGPLRLRRERRPQTRGVVVLDERGDGPRGLVRPLIGCGALSIAA
jgi:hypothetical protein